MRLLAVRIAAGFFALSWLIFPGFGLIDLGVTWDPGWPVALEAGWGVFMTVLVAGSFLAVAARPTRAASALVTHGIALGSLLVCAAAGLEVPVLGYAGILAVEVALVGFLPGRERLRPARWSLWMPLLVVAAAGVVPWLVYADRMFRSNRGNAGGIIGDVTMGVDHYAVQGALALALVAMTGLATCWPRGRRYLGVSAGVASGYLGLVSYAFPGTWAGFSPAWSVLCMAWAVAVAVLAVAAPRLEPSEFRGEVVEAERAL